MTSSICGPSKTAPRPPARLVLWVGFALLTGCAPADPWTDPDPNGVWASDGYGLMLTVRDSSLVTHELTAISCLAQPDTLLRLVDGGGNWAYGLAAGREAAVLLLPADGPDRMRLRRPGTASDIIVRRLAERPPACAAPPAATPTAMLELFIRTWEEQYILFDQKPVDWAALTAEARARVTDESSPRELFDVLSGLIVPFGDAHTGLMAPGVGHVRGARPGTDTVIPGGVDTLAARGTGWFLEEVAPRLFAATDRRLSGPRRGWCNDQLQSDLVGDDVGYLRVLSFSNYADGGYRAQRRCLDAALDAVFAGADRWRGMVIDVRVNFGGADPLALGIAERLATEEYVAYAKEARADPRDRSKWTPGQPAVVRPSERPGFRGPVVELTGPLTISAGETFTQALMGRTPPIARLGEHTQGVFSDVLGRHLPNGWQFWLPNEVFRTADGATFDGPGIPPTEPAPVFAEADLANGRDPALERALELLPAR